MRIKKKYQHGWWSIIFAWVQLKMLLNFKPIKLKTNHLKLFFLITVIVLGFFLTQKSQQHIQWKNNEKNVECFHSVSGLSPWPVKSKTKIWMTNALIMTFIFKSIWYFKCCVANDCKSKVIKKWSVKRGFSGKTVKCSVSMPQVRTSSRVWLKWWVGPFTFGEKPFNNRLNAELKLHLCLSHPQ